MTTEIVVQQIGPLSFLINTPLIGAADFVERALSTIQGARVTKNEAFRIAGEYESDESEVTTAFAIIFGNTTPDSTVITLEVRNEDSASMRNQVRDTIGSAIYSEYNPELQASERVQLADNLSYASQSTSETGPADRPRSVESVLPAAEVENHYKTTTALGSIISAIGWIGVVLSFFGGLIVSTTLGFVGIVSGFVAGFFCLLIVATGHLLRAQIEVANNSRLILELIKSNHRKLER